MLSNSWSSMLISLRSAAALVSRDQRLASVNPGDKAPDFVLGVAHCPLRESSGFPCPTCGGTLTATHLASGNWDQAVRANPLVALLALGYVPVAAAALAATIVPRWRRSLSLTPSEKKTARWLAVLLVVLNWAWLINLYLG